MTHPLIPILEQHCEEAAFLWELRQSVVGRPTFNLASLTDLDRRLEAHLDGILLAEEIGLKRVMSGLSELTTGSLFNAIVLSVRHQRTENLRQIFSLIEPDDALIESAGAAIGWLRVDSVSQLCSTILADNRTQNSSSKRVALIGLGLHGQDPGDALRTALVDDGANMRKTALQVAGKLRRTDLIKGVVEQLKSNDADIQFWAAWAAVMLTGARHIEHLEAVAARPGPHSGAAMALVARLLPTPAAVEWFKQLGHQEANRKTVIEGMGASGNPTFIPSLIRLMDNAKYSRAAGKTVALITGVDIVEEQLHMNAPPDHVELPNDDPNNDHVEMDEDEDLPWPNREAMSRWWESCRDKFHPGRRYLGGYLITRDNCLRILRAGPQAQRSAAAMELALLDKQKAIFDCSAPGFRQEAQLNASE